MSSLKRYLLIGLASVCAAIMLLPGGDVWAASDVTASDFQYSEAVNLKDHEWIYSTKKDGNGEYYALITKYSGNSTHVDVPEYFGNYPVRMIGGEAFRGCKYIVSVKISDGLTDIGRFAFKDCIGLSDITLPSSLMTINDGAFYGCRSLGRVVLPDGVTGIGNYAFVNCWHMTDIMLSQQLKSIGDEAFSGCSMLKAVSFGENLTSVGRCAFKGCSSLTSISLPDALNKAGDGAFADCVSLKTVKLGDGIESIPNSFFKSCVGLENVTFGKNIKAVGDSAFEGCEMLNSVQLNASVESIGRLAFSGCSSMKNIKLGANLKEIGTGSFSGCVGLKSIDVSENNKNYRSVGGILYTEDCGRLLLCPQGMMGKAEVSASAYEIADLAFMGCNMLTEIKLPEGLKKIGNGAFYDCINITSFELPESLEDIGSAAIGCCIKGGKTLNEHYLNVYGGSQGVAEEYCAKEKIKFTAYADTLLLGTENILLKNGDTFRIPYSFMTSHKVNMVWKSSDETIVTVNEKGVAEAVGLGSADITLLAEGFDPRTVHVSVEEITVSESSDVKINDVKKLYPGDEFDMNTVFELLMDQIIPLQKFWFSSNPKVALVSGDGHVTAIGCGKATVNCVSYDGAVRMCNIEVVEKPLMISAETTNAELAVGGSLQIKIELLPKKSKDAVIWKSSDESIASVDQNGKITAVGQGGCTLTATSESGAETKVQVTCYIPIEEMELDLSERSVYQGKSFTLDLTQNPSSSKERVLWYSSDDKVAAVNSKGRVTGVSFGTAYIYASTVEGVVTSCRVTVLAKAEKLSLDKKDLKFNTGDTFKLNAIILPSYSPETTESCTWSSTDVSVAEVDENGVVKGIKRGSCIINCKINGELISKCRVTVHCPTETVEIICGKSELYIGDVAVMKAKLDPPESDDVIEWSSDDADIAYVTSSGSVKAKAMGKAVITLKVTNEVTGKSLTDTFEIKILSAAEKVELSRTSISLQKGANDSITYMLTPSYSNDSVQWYSTDEAVASVRSDGLITAIGKGSCYICVETGSGKIAKCKVNVSE